MQDLESLIQEHLQIEQCIASVLADASSPFHARHDGYSSQERARNWAKSQAPTHAASPLTSPQDSIKASYSAGHVDARSRPLPSASQWNEPSHHTYRHSGIQSYPLKHQLSSDSYADMHALRFALSRHTKASQGHPGPVHSAPRHTPSHALPAPAFSNMQLTVASASQRRFTLSRAEADTLLHRGGSPGRVRLFGCPEEDVQRIMQETSYMGSPRHINSPSSTPQPTKRAAAQARAAMVRNQLISLEVTPGSAQHSAYTSRSPQPSHTAPYASAAAEAGHHWPHAGMPANRRDSSEQHLDNQLHHHWHGNHWASDVHVDSEQAGGLRASHGWHEAQHVSSLVPGLMEHAGSNSASPNLSPAHHHRPGSNSSRHSPSLRQSTAHAACSDVAKQARHKARSDRIGHIKARLRQATNTLHRKATTPGSGGSSSSPPSTPRAESGAARVTSKPSMPSLHLTTSKDAVSLTPFAVRPGGSLAPAAGWGSLAHNPDVGTPSLVPIGGTSALSQLAQVNVSPWGVTTTTTTTTLQSQGQADGWMELASALHSRAAVGPLQALLEDCEGSPQLSSNHLEQQHIPQLSEPAARTQHQTDSTVPGAARLLAGQQAQAIAYPPEAASCAHQQQGCSEPHDTSSQTTSSTMTSSIQWMLASEGSAAPTASGPVPPIQPAGTISSQLLRILANEADSPAVEATGAAADQPGSVMRPPEPADKQSASLGGLSEKLKQLLTDDPAGSTVGQGQSSEPDIAASTALVGLPSDGDPDCCISAEAPLEQLVTSRDVQGNVDDQPGSASHEAALRMAAGIQRHHEVEGASSGAITALPSSTSLRCGSLVAPRLAVIPEGSSVDQVEQLVVDLGAEASAAPQHQYAVQPAQADDTSSTSRAAPAQAPLQEAQQQAVQEPGTQQLHGALLPAGAGATPPQVQADAAEVGAVAGHVAGGVISAPEPDTTSASISNAGSVPAPDQTTGSEPQAPAQQGTARSPRHKGGSQKQLQPVEHVLSEIRAIKAVLPPEVMAVLAIALESGNHQHPEVTAHSEQLHKLGQLLSQLPLLMPSSEQAKGRPLAAKMRVLHADLVRWSAPVLVPLNLLQDAHLYLPQDAASHAAATSAPEPSAQASIPTSSHPPVAGITPTFSFPPVISSNQIKSVNEAMCGTGLRAGASMQPGQAQPLNISLSTVTTPPPPCSSDTPTGHLASTTLALPAAGLNTSLSVPAHVSKVGSPTFSSPPQQPLTRLNQQLQGVQARAQSMSSTTPPPGSHQATGTPVAQQGLRPQPGAGAMQSSNMLLNSSGMTLSDMAAALNQQVLLNQQAGIAGGVGFGYGGLVVSSSGSQPVHTPVQAPSRGGAAAAVRAINHAAATLQQLQVTASQGSPAPGACSPQQPVSASAAAKKPTSLKKKLSKFFSVKS